MSWSLAANIATVVEAIAVSVSLIFIAWQLKLQTHITKFSNVQTLVELSSPIMLLIIENPTVAKLWYTGKQNYDQFTPTEQAQYRHMLVWWLTYYENIFQQKRSGLMDDLMYEAWLNDIKSFVKLRAVARHWGSLEHLYEYKFRTHISNLIYEDHQKRRPEGTAQP